MLAKNKKKTHAKKLPRAKKLHTSKPIHVVSRSLHTPRSRPMVFQSEYIHPITTHILQRETTPSDAGCQLGTVTIAHRAHRTIATHAQTRPQRAQKRDAPERSTRASSRSLRSLTAHSRRALRDATRSQGVHNKPAKKTCAHPSHSIMMTQGVSAERMSRQRCATIQKNKQIHP